MASSTCDNWFIENILVHEGLLTQFLSDHWRKSDEIPDLRQETYARVYRSAVKRRPEHPKAYLLSTARNLLVDRVRRDNVVSIEAIADIESLEICATEPSSELLSSYRQELRVLQAAIEKLPPRCQRVFMMRKIEGYTQRETAQALGISVATVEKQISKGIKRLADELQRTEHPKRAPGALPNRRRRDMDHD